MKNYPNRNGMNASNSIRGYVIFGILVCMFLCACNGTKNKIDNKMQNGVVLVLKTEFYQVTLPDENVFYFSGDGDGNITNWSFDREDCESMSTGTGFFISDDGKIATNKHVASRMVSNKDLVRLTKKIINLVISTLEDENKAAEQMQQQIAYQHGQSNDVMEKASLVQRYNELEEEIEDRKEMIKYLERTDVSGAKIDHCSKLYVAYNGTFVNSMEDFYPCTLRDTSEYDLAVIQLDNKQTPKDRYVFNVPDDNMLEHYSFGEFLSKMVGSDKNERLYMIGFNYGFDVAITGEGIFSQCTEGSVSRDEKDRIMYSIATLQGSSGSPVLNRRGQLVAVNYAGIKNGQNFNFGIKAMHLYELIHKNR